MTEERYARLFVALDWSLLENRLTHNNPIGGGLGFYGNGNIDLSGSQEEVLCDESYVIRIGMTQIEHARGIRDLGGLGRGIPGDGVIVTGDPDGAGVWIDDWRCPHIARRRRDREGKGERIERAYGGEKEEKNHDGRDEEGGTMRRNGS